jgi:S1-C subfamily serine protease
MSSARGRPPFFWFALVAGCWMLLVYGNGIWSALTRETIAGRAPVSYAYREGAWFVTGVVPKSPADGVLRRGDRILSINGDRRAGRIGTELFVRFLDPGSQLEFGLLRDGAEQHAVLPLTAFPPSHTRSMGAS